MASFGSAELIEALWQQPLTDEQLAAAESLLDAITVIIRASVPDLDDRITAATLDSALVDYVAAAAVLRVLRNPEGLRSTTRAIDDYSETNVRDQALSDGALRLLDHELALLRGRRATAFSIRPAPGACDEIFTEQVAAHRAAWNRP